MAELMSADVLDADPERGKLRVPVVISNQK
jgi:hypothetical protein